MSLRLNNISGQTAGQGMPASQTYNGYRQTTDANPSQATIPLGTPHSTRHVVLTFAYNRNVGLLNSVQIGSTVFARKVGIAGAEIWAADMPEDESGVLSVVLVEEGGVSSGGDETKHIGVRSYSLYGLTDKVPVDTGTGSNGGTSKSHVISNIETVTGGCLIAVHMHQNSGDATLVWNGTDPATDVGDTLDSLNYRAEGLHILSTDEANTVRDFSASWGSNAAGRSAIATFRARA